jgi:type II secretory pathway pseudopilin PulG
MARPTATGRAGPGHEQAGFSFLGLLFLLAGLGVALAALGTVWSTAAQREKELDLLFIGDQYRRAIESFWKIPLPVGTPRRLPKNFDELLVDPRFPNTVRHLRRVWRDPLTGFDEWGLVREPDGGISGIHSLSARQPSRAAIFRLSTSSSGKRAATATGCFASMSRRPSAKPSRLPARPLERVAGPEGCRRYLNDNSQLTRWVCLVIVATYD